MRQAHPNDVRQILYLLRENQHETSNLSQNPDMLSQDINKSCLNFFRLQHKSYERFANPFYFFVLEDENGGIVGTSLIKNVTHRLIYQLDRDCIENRICLKLSLVREAETLELGGLLLDKNVRRKGLAKLLSYSRLVFLDLVGLPVEKVMTEFDILQNVERDFFWKLSGRQTIDLSRKCAELYWRDNNFLWKLVFKLPSPLHPSATTISALGFPSGAPTINKTAERARSLLEKLGFRYLFEIEANGGAWYGCGWQKLQAQISSHAIPFRYLVDNNGGSWQEKEAISCWLEHGGFKANFITVGVSEKHRPFVYVNKKDLMSIRQEQKHLVLFP